MNGVYPTELKIVDEDVLLIEWSDGRRKRYSFRELRENCPCATCRDLRTKNPPRPESPESPPNEEPAPRVQSMKPVGNYAYSIAFSDGHDTGIYTFDLLRQLGGEEP